MKPAGIVNIYRRRRDLKNAVAILETKNVFVRPVPQPPVFRQAVPTDPRPGEYNIAMGRPNLNGSYYFNKITGP